MAINECLGYTQGEWEQVCTQQSEEVEVCMIALSYLL